MAWDHELAKQLNRGKNTGGPVWFAGEVLSTEELIISAYDGQIMLRSDRLRKPEHVGELSAGQRVALLGNPFGSAPGSQTVLILGVIGDAV